MLLSQQHSNPMDARLDLAGDARAVEDRPRPSGRRSSAPGPSTSTRTSATSSHLINKDYERLGEKDAQVFYQRVVLGIDWQPLQPTGASRSGQVITVTFNVPVPPLAWDTTLPAPHQASNTAWAQGKGFEVLERHDAGDDQQRGHRRKQRADHRGQRACRPRA